MTPDPVAVAPSRRPRAVTDRSLPAALAILLGLAGVGAAGAQLSPGPLAAAHLPLEGSSHCLECHRAGRGVEAGLCLDCHRALDARISSGRGLHARPGHEACERCHIEHHGRDFELVWWGDGGPQGFDHREVGYVLEGAHAALECRSCHRAERLPDPEALRRGGADPATTFLGLATGCSRCHRDVHGAALGASGCDRCHDQERWRPAPGFEHDHTGWPLRGRHRTAGCDRCHSRTAFAPVATASSAAPTVAAEDRLFVGDVRGTSCVACHGDRDPHGGRLGRACESCHRESSWSAVDAGSLDHDRTRFPLAGLHRGLACAACHAGGGATVTALLVSPDGDGVVPLPALERCESCHHDPHAGQLGGGAEGGGCRSCHDEHGFTSPRFTIEDHARTAYPLEGAHLAVPCDRCHLPLAQEAAGPVSGRAEEIGPGGAGPRRYHFDSTACAACHASPHEAEASARCDACHDSGDWRRVRFDHGASDFALAGAHARAECGACHDPARAAAASPVREGEVVPRFRLGGLPLACEGCHADVHRGQLARAGEAARGAVGTACERCHGLERFVPAEGFDHDRDARWPLGGAHRDAPCAGCHPAERSDRGTVIRYRPLAWGCADCHAAAPVRGARGGRP